MIDNNRQSNSYFEIVFLSLPKLRSTDLKFVVLVVIIYYKYYNF